MPLDWKIFTQRPYIKSLPLEEQTRLFYIANEKSIRYRTRSGDGDTGVTFMNTKSIEFDGISDYIRTTANTTFNGLTAFSISCWIKTDGTQQDYAAVVGYQSSTSQYVKLAFYPSEKDRIRVVIRPGTTNPVYVKSSAGSIVDGEWVHIVAVGDANNLSNLNVYINGALDNDVTQGNITTLAQSSDIYIGTDAGAPTTREFKGLIDEVSIFNDALSSEDVSNIYNSGTPTDLSSYSSLVHWWRMGDGDTFPTITDKKGNNDGTMTNMTSDDIVEDVPS